MNRKHGWAARRSLKVIEAKEPISPDIAYGAYAWEDACEYGWYGCGENGCCVDTDWAVRVMPPMIFAADGLVHITKPREPVAVCGVAGNWPDPPLQSTDEVEVYARSLGRDFRDITCLTCIVYARFDNVFWRDL